VIKHFDLVLLQLEPQVLLPLFLAEGAALSILFGVGRILDNCQLSVHVPQIVACLVPVDIEDSIEIVEFVLSVNGFLVSEQEISVDSDAHVQVFMKVLER